MLSVSFFSLQSVSMTLARRYVWSGTPLKAGRGPAAAHCNGLTACAADPGCVCGNAAVVAEPLPPKLQQSLAKDTPIQTTIATKCCPNYLKSTQKWTPGGHWGHFGMAKESTFGVDAGTMPMPMPMSAPLEIAVIWSMLVGKVKKSVGN